MRESVTALVGRGTHPAATEIEYVPRVRKVLALAVDEAQTLGHDHVGTEHLLLGLVREGQGIAAGILDMYGAIAKVRERTLSLLKQAEESQMPEIT